MALLTVGQQQGAWGGNTGWSALTEAVKMFGTEAITQEFSKKILKWQAYVGGESTNCATFKIKAVECCKFVGICGYGKRGRRVKKFHSMLKYNNLFVA